MSYPSLVALSVLLLLGAGCVPSYQKENQATGSSQTVLQKTTELATADTFSMTTYRTSGNVAVLFDAPTGWFVRQLDGGGISVVQIRETQESPLQASIAIASPWSDEDGHRATYEEWLVLRGFTQPSARFIESEVVKFDAWESTQEDAVVYTLLLDAQGSKYLFVDMPSAFDQTTARAIVRSINPFATQEEQDAAVPVR